MAKKTEKADKVLEQQAVFPTGVHFGAVQLPIDLQPKPSAQRIVQFFHTADQGLRCYISENAFIRSELFMIMDRMFKESYRKSIAKGSVALLPVKMRLHWCEFTEEFCATGKGLRIDPETGKPEDESLN